MMVGAFFAYRFRLFVRAVFARIAMLAKGL
jgi:hypothetical protein